MSLLAEKTIINTSAPLTMREVMPYRFPLKVAADRAVRLILIAEDGYPFALNCTAGQLPDVAQAYGLVSEEGNNARPGPSFGFPNYTDTYGAEEKDGAIEYLHEAVFNFIRTEMDEIVKEYTDVVRQGQDPYSPDINWYLRNVRRDRSFTYVPAEKSNTSAPPIAPDMSRAASAVSATFGPFYSEAERRARPAVLGSDDINEARDLLRFAGSVLELLAYSEGLPVAQTHRAAELAWALVGRANEALSTSGDEE